jgi:hypothetical protein
LLARIASASLDARHRAAGIHRQKKFVKLNTQRKAIKKESKTKPKACNPYGPTRILETAEFSIASLSRELLKSTHERASSQNIAFNTIAIDRQRRIIERQASVQVRRRSNSA